MIKMPKVFSSNALYLHSAPLELRGHTEVNKAVKAEILKGEECFVCAEAVSDVNGDFVICVNTPNASYDTYTIKVSTSDSELTMENILFGELWFAGGQSNMEMPNLSQPEWKSEVSKTIRGKNLRFFGCNRLPGGAEFPMAPVSDTDGFWMSGDYTDKVSHVSALATVFCNDLYDFFLERGEQIPVGFLDCNKGGTCIETWLPAYAFDLKPALEKRKPDIENWNKKGDNNYQQSSAEFNYNTSPLIGVKTRGILWYQGETNVRDSDIYKDMLKALHITYKKIFAANDGEIFPLVCSQIYPWRYFDGDECRVGYFNQCFTDICKTDPEVYPCVPLCDLPPVWMYTQGNHPIHPAHKYALGHRFATLCLNKYYGRQVKNKQTVAPTLKSCTRHGSKLRLTFSDVGSGLYINGKNIRGLYIRSKNGAYTPAMCEIISKNVMNVYHPYIDAPVHCAYAVSSFEGATNLMAGEFAVAPFCTEFKNGVKDITISRKPWLDNEIDSVMTFNPDFIGDMDVLPRPVFYPSQSSFISYDRAFSVSGRAVCVRGEGSEYGVYIVSSQYSTLDFENYDALKAQIYNYAQNDVKLTLYYKEENGARLAYSVNGVFDGEDMPGWGKCTFELTQIPKGHIEKAEFAFKSKANKVPFALIDCMIMVPKK